MKYILLIYIIFLNLNLFANFVDLNKEEKQYLQKKKELKLCIDPSWMPLEKIENNKHIGITSDIMDLISQNIKTPIILVQTSTWTESLEKIKRKECDILSLIAKTSSREKYLNFTSPYIKLPLVIATKAGLPFIDSLNKIKEKQLAVIKNYSIIELLNTKYPNIKLIEVDSAKEALTLVEQEKIFGFLDSSMVINHEIQKNNIMDIGITGQLKESFELSIASQNDNQILNGILEKALLTIDEKVKIDIIEKWNNIQYQTQIDYKLVLQTLFFSIALISVFIYWNLKLKEEIKNKELAQKKLKQSEEKFRTLFDIAPVLLNSFDENGKIILWNKECEKVFGWTFEELQKEETPLDLFYPDPLTQEALIRSFNEADTSFYLDWYPLTKYGETIITRWANIKLKNNEVINIGYDITKERKNEKSIKEKTIQLKNTKKQLEELNTTLEKRISNEIKKNTKQQAILMHQSKLIQMGKMIENIAHQWRQPLAQVNSSVLLIDMEFNKNKFKSDIIENKLQEIENLTEYMSKTIDDFKNFFDPNKEKDIFEIKDAIEKALEVVKGLIKVHHIEINLELEENLKCYSYIKELQQVFLIIINNAIDAIVQTQVPKGEIFIKAYMKNNKIFIKIEDNGLGVKNKHIDNIFDPYFTTKQKKQGTGIGLYMAKMIIENGLQGKLKVKNKEYGASFKITIPKGEMNGKKTSL